MKFLSKHFASGECIVLVEDFWDLKNKQAWVEGGWNGEGGQKVQTSGYKTHKSWGCNVHISVVTIVKNSVLHIWKLLDSRS